MELTFCLKDPPVGAVLTCGIAGVPFIWGSETQLVLDDFVRLTTSHAISRHIARLHPDLNLYPTHILHRTEVDHWLSVASSARAAVTVVRAVLPQLNTALAPSHCLVPPHTTVADYELFSVLYCSEVWRGVVAGKEAPPHVLRWYNAMHTQVASILSGLPSSVKAVTGGCSSCSDTSGSSTSSASPARGATGKPPAAKLATGGKPTGKLATKKTTTEASTSAATSGKGVGGVKQREDGGKFVDLPGARVGEVVVRFPPEASGYLHIGHAKAALLNQYYQLAFQGKLVMRFDDTNPAKEDAHFEEVILADLKMLEVKPDCFTHTSDYFGIMITYCEDLMRKSFAYVDNTDGETMKKEREERKESLNRNNSVEKNLAMWEEMKAGSEAGKKCAVRAKINMASDNGCMRDPTIYRCKSEPHIKTGTTYKVYPTYDFACPIVDSIEGVTHALRTTEYHDRDEQYFWFLEKIGLRKLHIYEYSRLNMNNTVLSKRKLAWFVEQGLVDGWDDPRFPTVRGILRRGMTIQGLKDFIIAQGSSRAVVNMEWDKIWSFNKKVIDATAPRYTALTKDDLIPVNVSNTTEKATTAQKHPKDAGIGTKTVWVGPKVLIELVDAESLKEGENATFINWGNLLIKKINRENGKIVTVDADPNLENTDYKKTLKLTWLVDSEKSPSTPAICVYFDHIISKGVLGKDEDFKNFVNKNTRFEVSMVGDDELKQLKVGDIIQLQRKGFFRVDEQYAPATLSACKESPVVFFYIPDGHKKSGLVIEEASAASKVVFVSNKESAQSVKGKKAEKSPQEEAIPFTASAGNQVMDIHLKIKEQGDKIRKLKSEKADKNVITSEVGILKELKINFSSVAGVEWQPAIDISQFMTSSAHVAEGSSKALLDMHQKIVDQGNVVRTLKTNKGGKDDVKNAVDVLLSLKKQFKEETGVDWKPDVDMSKVAVAPLASQPAAATPSVTPTATLATASATDACAIHDKIVKQGTVVRNLKAEKAVTEVLKAAVDVLLDLKKNFKGATNVDWKPDIDINQFKKQVTFATPATSTHSAETKEAVNINNKIKEQGDKIRIMKSNKAEKKEIKSQVDILLALKTEFKNATNVEWTPNVNINELTSGDRDKPVVITTHAAAPTPKTAPVVAGMVPAFDLHGKITVQGGKVRELKANKADKNIVKAEVDILLALKKEFKDTTQVDWTPTLDISNLKAASTPASRNNVLFEELNNKVKAQGDKIRQLKAEKADKDSIKIEVEVLLQCKKNFKDAFSVDWKPDLTVTQFSGEKAGTPPPVKSEKPKDKKKQTKKDDVADGKKQTRLGMEVLKVDNFSEWYSQVIIKSEMIEYYNVSGCYILRPWSYTIWDFIKAFIDMEIKKLGVENSYFPMFITKDQLEKEKSHIADFSPEVAWVTRSGSTDLAEPIAIRPTSETVMYPSFAKWVQSHRDLPIRLNQWNNVVRWEFKQPTPFLRTREFLWQEGHSAFATKQEAMTEVYQILDIYSQVYEDLLAVPVVKGRKTEKEKFAGGDFTITTEGFISASGRAIQGSTSHHLGQNFSKMFDIVFEDPITKEKEYAYQNSWGFTTRSIGVMVMVHGDDKGLVLPPKVASLQAVIMPVGITAKTTEEEKNNLFDACKKLEEDLNGGGVRTRADLRDHVTPAWKFNYWELKGVPLRLELGPREVASDEVFVVRRDTGDKRPLCRATIINDIHNLLVTIQATMFEKAKVDLNNHIKLISSWDEFCPHLDSGNMILAPFCGEETCEDTIKKDSARDMDSEPGAPSMGAKALCVPFEQPKLLPSGTPCIHPTCSRHGNAYCLFGRSY